MIAAREEKHRSVAASIQAKALMIAARAGDHESVAAIIRAKAPVDARDNVSEGTIWHNKVLGGLGHLWEQCARCVAHCMCFFGSMSGLRP